MRRVEAGRTASRGSGSSTQSPGNRPPEALVEEFLARQPYQLDEFQLQAIRALGNHHSVLVAAPTGTGKTVVGEFGIFMARQNKLRAFYTTPIKALSNQKYRDFRAIW